MAREFFLDIVLVNSDQRMPSTLVTTHQISFSEKSSDPDMQNPHLRALQGQRTQSPRHQGGTKVLIQVRTIQVMDIQALYLTG